MKDKPIDDIRILEILDVIQQLAAGNFKARTKLFGTKDDIDAIMIGLNMLAEELEAKGK
ncbi:MAG: hypothetical protein ABIB65_05555 [Candidatus Margulisiibacteriota bacterium]